MAPVPFSGRMSANDDDGPPSPPPSASAGGYLHSLELEDSGETDNLRSILSKGKSKMGRSTSMLEMDVVRDMVRFGEAMDALSAPPAGGTANASRPPPPEAPKGDDDGGFFIEADDADDDDCRDVFHRLSSSPDSVADGPTTGADLATSPPKYGGMRRSASAVSLSSNRARLSAMMQGMGAISEEGDECDDGRGREHRPAAPSPPPPPSRRATVGSEGAPAPVGNRRRATFGSDGGGEIPMTCPPRRMSSGSSAGMPLRSSMKGSRNNLRAMSLNSDDGSFDSVDQRPPGMTMKRNVSFSSLEIRSYNVTLGDAPTQNGPAISLSWNYDPDATEKHTLDGYETYRTDEAPRRTRHEMLMPASHRQYLLMMEGGVTRAEMRTAMEEAKKVALGRQKTIRRDRLGLQPVEYALERTKRKVFGKGKGKKF